MKIVFISLFPVLFAVGAVLEPLSYDTLSAVTIGLLVVTAVLDRIGMWLARKNRFGVEMEEFGTVESVTFLNNPWAKNWPHFRRFMHIVLVCQILAMAALTLWLGEVVRRMYIGNPS